MTSAAILHIQQMLFWALNCHHIASMKMQIKFVAEIQLFVYYQDDRCLPSWIVIFQFWTTHEVKSLDGLYLPCQWRNDPV